ncbi:MULTISPECIES: CBS domain-containing protein [Actinokineospora]|uniref:Hypoxic response protein 1 n=1 Tax=Actinokineospora fastidiosa TaxID=1816 RepID=A0A918GBM4_9PSEU|nr:MULTISPECIES: CBS domain-containing protein [Actinokineospora]UVS79321.1 Hypoxic response protein 1 [Actinokineospora sp. UTMC 2448]GGS27624.1 hypoxic response protein 1 [Actinokineospora fastidiosa]
MTSKNLKARDIMHRDVRCIPPDRSLREAAQLMRELDVGALPICDNDRLGGMITDRDIVVRCIAEGGDPGRVRAGELAQGTPRWIDADADVQEVLDTMERHQIKRLPVIDTQAGMRLVGIISEAEIARNLSDEKIAEFVGKVYTPH